MDARSTTTGNLLLFQFAISGCPEKLLVIRFSGHESISSQFELQLEVACEDPAIDFASVMGKPALLSLMSEGQPRFIHGIVSRFEQVNNLPRNAIYQVTVVPQVWKLKHRHDNRIFQDETTEQIITKVLKKAGIPSDCFKFALTGSYEPRNYCVQYRESDWAFISRLLEEDGIFYFFEHSAAKHVLVMGDSAAACKPIPAGKRGETVPFRRVSGTVITEDHVQRFRFSEEIQPGQVMLRDFNFKKPTLSTEGKFQAEKDPDLMVYDYPGEYQLPGRGSTAKGETIAQIRLEEWQTVRKTGFGESDCERLTPGFMFTLADHTRGDFNTRYLITSVGHQGYQPQVLDEESGGGDFSYSNHFSCIVAKTPYRPLRVTPKPIVRGVQTAVVVGPKNEEIHTDEHGRVKVQFHWDREGKKDENSSCWIRVSHAWAGQHWGAIYIPRIGHEVIVDFIEGDPDRPIITGRVYNGDNPPPYKLPDQKTKSTLKSNSSKGGDGYNEIRFEDRKKSEQLFVHAERNMDVHVKNDSLENILHDRHQTIGSESKNGKVGDQNEMVYRDKNLKVHRNSQDHIGGDWKLLVGGIDGPGNADVVVKASRTEKVGADSHLTVVGNRNEKIDGTWSITLGADLQVKATGIHALQADSEIHLKSDKIVLEADTGLTLKVGGNFITIDATGVSVTGMMVNLNSGGAALDGSGAKPTAPSEPAEAMPTAPTPADSGQ
ncbi:type VI secretion system Vgr family protein [Hyalangium minutum]|uniref:VgrG protein n=1 Tax=Hyalangium minutum TaxID=394096 RepID=A0A085WU16_9BACT|nr:type VI secretion system tip protein VgrG [Hyalangium minutum]KFE71179.1 VgrG protein [Hyalangium minutum]